MSYFLYFNCKNIVFHLDWVWHYNFVCVFAEFWFSHASLNCCSVLKHKNLLQWCLSDRRSN